jgi:hypothetical protein
MDIFFNVVVAGMAVAFLLSLSSSLLEGLVSIRIFRLVITWPMSIVAVMFVGILDLSQISVTSLAASFFALTVLRVVERNLEKPTIVDRRRI